MLRAFAAVVTFALLLTGLTACGSDETIKATSEKEEDSPQLSANVVHTFFSKDPLARFAVEFTNGDDKSRVGVKATWEALDADGVIVGTHNAEIPPILPGEATYYVGGAGGANLTGVPAQIEVEVTDEGEAVSKVEPSGVTVESVDFEKTDYSFIPGVRAFEVSLVLVATRDLSPRDISTVALLRNKKGKVIGADWGDTDTAPDQITAGEKFRVKSDVYVRNGTPATADAYAWE